MAASKKHVLFPIDDIVKQGNSPLPDLDIPSIAKDFYNAIAASELAMGRVVKSAYLRGGALPDLHRGQKPKDYDLQLCCPELIRAMEEVYQKGRDIKESEGEINENLKALFGKDFPFSFYEPPDPPEHSKSGLYIRLSGAWKNANGQKAVIDLLLTEKDFPIAEISARTSSPIMSAVVSLHSETPVYAFHKRFPSDVQNGIMGIPKGLKIDDGLREKARRKGLQILTIQDDPPTFI